MKRILCLTLALLMTLSALLCLPACSGKNKLPADYVKGDGVVIDNETPFVYNDSTVKYYHEKYNGETVSLDISDFVYHLSYVEERDFSYAYLASVFGNKIVRHYTEGDKDTYYTVYSLPDNELFYLSLCMKDGALYLDKDPYSGLNETLDARWDNLNGYVYEQDFPAAILGDALPADCYPENYTPEEIARNVEEKWSLYNYHCNAVNIPHSSYVDRDNVRAYPFVRCIQSVSFDIVRNDTGYDGVYVYDFYAHKDGGGVLYFYHLDDQSFLPSYTYTLIQEETIPLTAEEVASVLNVMTEWDFANQPTWNPEEFTGFDGETTYIYGQGKFGDTYREHLIVMWSASERYAHYHIRTALENLVRAHVTVEEGRIYNPKTQE